MDNNLTKFIKILNSIREDGALEKEDWIILLPLIIKLVKQLRAVIDGKPFLSIGLAGVEHVLEETLEHVCNL